MMYKDACNQKSNQQNLGTIRSSNLCTEIVQFTSKDEIAVCNLASVALPKFVISDSIVGGLKFDFDALLQVTKTVVVNLNRVIDRNFYPLEAARRSNLRHRPIGVGVQGLADVFIMLGLPFDSDDARGLNRDIFETMYFASLEASVELAAIDGPYDSYVGSPVSKGILQFDMWGELWNGTGKYDNPTPLDWNGLKHQISNTGVRNSLLMAPMPTASTSQILGNNECIEPYTSNMYVRRVLSGEFPVINKHLIRTLLQLKLWTFDIRNQLIATGGSIQQIGCIPDDIKRLYKTVWEISQRMLIDMAADRGQFIDQSQSLNLFMSSPDVAKLTSMHFYGWTKGLKTGIYYLRTRPKVDAIQFTVDQSALQRARGDGAPVSEGADVRKDHVECEMCSS